MLLRASRPTPARRAAAALLTAAAVLAGLLLAAAPSAVAAPLTGSVDSASQDAAGVLTVSGWAVDPTHPGASTWVTVWVDGRFVHGVRAAAARPDVDRRLHLTGRHGFRLVIRLSRTAHRVVVRVPGRAHTVVSTRAVAHPSDAGARVVALARRFVGARYVDGGASPAGFDCSGYTQYVYAHARVAALPHNAEAQRRRARRLSRAQARPGDLVFYLSGGSAYHVAIYAGNGRQYAAATPRDGVRYQPIWSSAVRFGTTWH